MIPVCVRVAAAIALALTGPVVLAAQERMLVPAGATWRYLYDGSDPGTAWREPGFADSGWKAGPAKLGYGGDREVTALDFGVDSGNKPLTAYFRHAVTVTRPGAFKQLIVRLIRDDGAVVYVNGTEVWRTNMPAGRITGTTPATRAAEYAGGAGIEYGRFSRVPSEGWHEITLDPRVLVPGRNVIAVEVHQSNTGSSDLGFDLELIGSTSAVVRVSAPSTGSATPNGAASPVTDGPYVRWVGDTAAAVRSVCQGTVHTDTAHAVQGVLRIEHACAQGEETALSASPPTVEPATFTNVSRVLAVSDVEGAYDAFVAFLKAAGAIDAERHWAWGDGHLVLVGDMVDRGAQVTEVLWLIHRLEQEARRAGGRVHYVLGNHDAMLLYGDHRYVAPKYRQVAERLGTPLLDLFGPMTEFGRWMRTKPVMLRIDSVLFTHGGMAPAFAARGLSLEAVNAAARAGLATPEARKADSVAALVLGAGGPLWYRGYFRGRDMATPGQIKEALARYGARTVVVGHTVVPTIARMHDGRVVAIDVTFKRPERVEGLLIEQGRFYRIAADGTRTALP